jgi:hypothetical protein
MQPQILKVDDIGKAIQENGLKYYVDRILQDSIGDYWWVEYHCADPDEKCDTSFDSGWHNVSIKKESQDEHGSTIFVSEWWKYRVVQIPRDVAWFCIDAIKLQTQVMNIGRHGYGQHGGDVKWYIKGDDGFQELPTKAFGVEEL